MALAAIVPVLLAAACEERREPMKKDEIVRAASAFARERGYDPDRYEVRDVRRDAREALVLFHGKSERPGDHFTVVVDLSTGKATELVPGS